MSGSFAAAGIRRVVPYLVFIVGYGGLLFLAGFAAFWLDSRMLDFTTTWIASFVVAPLALLLAMRWGRPNRAGIAFATFVFAAGICIATVGVFIVIALPTGRLTVPQVLGMFPTYFSLGGWTLLLGYLLVIAAPLLWSGFILRPRAPGAAASA